jgi:hypothetical protein
MQFNLLGLPLANTSGIDHCFSENEVWSVVHALPESARIRWIHRAVLPVSVAPNQVMRCNATSQLALGTRLPQNDTILCCFDTRWGRHPQVRTESHPEYSGLDVTRGRKTAPPAVALKTYG